MGSGDFPNLEIPGFTCYFWFPRSREHLSAFVVANIRGTKKKQTLSQNPRWWSWILFFFLGEKQKERYFWQKKDIGFSISQERKRLEQVVDNPQNRLTQLKTGEKTRWSTRLCFLFIWFLMTICTANTGYVYIYISPAKHLPGRFDVFALFIRYIDITRHIFVYIFT